MMRRCISSCLPIANSLASHLCRPPGTLQSKRASCLLQPDDRSEDWLLPVVYQNQPQSLHVRPFTPEESNAYYKKVADRYNPAQPGYGFVGRDLDILQIEKLLLTSRNILLVQGMGGAGKSTLLRHLGKWWQTTGLVEHVFYFGYDEKAWTRQQIMTILPSDS